MKYRLFPLLLALLVLSGCSWMKPGDRVSIVPHSEEKNKENPETVSASTYAELLQAVISLVEAGAETGLVYIPEYENERIQTDLDKVIRYCMTGNPIGAYALDSIRYELGAGSGQQAVAVELDYLHDRSEIRRIRNCRNVDEAREIIAAALDACSDSLVLQIEDYDQTDFIQEVRDFADANPSVVMELPEVAVGVYPETGSRRVVELKFTYETSREVLRSMQTQVRPIFDAAVLYVSGDGGESEKFSQLFAFLMERFDYQYGISLTPIYSLLRHGVGDCKAFALVYAAMSSDAGLDCRVVPGTKNGETWYWNMVCIDGEYYHADLLESAGQGDLQLLLDADMAGYVWDYSAFPQCVASAENAENSEE